MGTLGNLVPLIILFAFLALGAWVGYQVAHSSFPFLCFS